MRGKALPVQNVACQSRPRGLLFSTNTWHCDAVCNGHTTRHGPLLASPYAGLQTPLLSSCHQTRCTPGLGTHLPRPERGAGVPRCSPHCHSQRPENLSILTIHFTHRWSWGQGHVLGLRASGFSRRCPSPSQAWGVRLSFPMGCRSSLSLRDKQGLVIRSCGPLVGIEPC